MNEELRFYVKSQLDTGIPEGEIRNTLLEQGGWSTQDLDNVFLSLDTTKAPEGMQNAVYATDVAIEVNTDSPDTTPSPKHTFSLARAIAGIFGVIVLSLVGIFVTFSIQNESQEEIASSTEHVEYSQKELVSYIRPSIVSIVTNFSGEVTLKPFKIDLFDLKITDSSKEDVKTEFDENITGSGFVVSEDGHILTNSHVVGKEIFEESFIDGVAIGVIYASAFESISDPRNETTEEHDEKVYEGFGEEIREHIRNNIEFKIETKVYVSDIRTEAEDIEEIIEDSFEASVLYENDNVIDDQKDVALIKIDESNLPSIVLTGDLAIEAGDEIFVFGFPASATFNRASLFKPSFTKGLVSSVKRSDNDDFDIYQLDAKISSGSSGGPVLSEDGDVVGIVTWQSGTQDIGDNFAFALPSSFGANVLGESNVINKIGSYNSHFDRAIRLSRRNHCKAALKEFDSAEMTANAAFVESGYLDSQRAYCEGVIELGVSVDTRGQEFVRWFRDTNKAVWYIITGSLIFIIVMFVGYRLLSRRIRRNTNSLRRD